MNTWRTIFSWEIVPIPTDYIVRERGNFYIDSNTMNADAPELPEYAPGNPVEFFWKGKKYHAIVSNEAFGRDDDVHKLDNVAVVGGGAVGSLKLSWEVYDVKDAKFGGAYLYQIQEGLVLLGAGGDPREWVEGVTNILNEEGIAKGSVQELWGNTIYKLTTSGGRTDLVLPMVGHFDTGKLAIWRLQFGDASWWSDYKENYKGQH